MGPVDGYTAEEWRAAIGALPQERLQESAQALTQALEGAADQREQYWKNRIQPFWQYVWPKSRDLATPNISESLARLCIAASSEFPAALTAVRDWLRERFDYPVFVAAPKTVGITSTGDTGEGVPNDLPDLLRAYREFEHWLAQGAQPGATPNFPEPSTA